MPLQPSPISLPDPGSFVLGWLGAQRRWCGSARPSHQFSYLLLQWNGLVTAVPYTERSGGLVSSHVMPDVSFFGILFVVSIEFGDALSLAKWNGPRYLSMCVSVPLIFCADLHCTCLPRPSAPDLHCACGARCASIWSATKTICNNNSNTFVINMSENFSAFASCI